MRSLLRSLVILPFIVGLSSALFSSEVLASTSNSTNQSTNLSANIQSGDLSLVAPSEKSSFPGLKLNGQIQKVSASLSPWQVIDATGTGNGWSVTVSATQFTEIAPSGGFSTGTTALTLPTGSMALVSQGTVTPSTGSQPVSSSGGPLFENVGSVMDGGSFEYLKASTNHGMGTFNVTPSSNDLQLTIDPSSTKVDTVNYAGQPTPYESTITFSLDSAPSATASTSTTSTSTSTPIPSQPTLTQVDSPVVIPYGFISSTGQYQYMAVGTTAPTVSGGSNVSITPEGNISSYSNINGYLVTSGSKLSSIGYNGQSTPVQYYNGQVSFVGSWDSGSYTIPSGNSVALVVSTTEGDGSSDWKTVINGVTTSYSQNVSAHYVLQAIPTTEASASVNWVSGTWGIQYTFVAYGN